MKKVLVLNGPNLNLLGKREPDIYGNRTLSDIENDIKQHAVELGLDCHCYQSNYEGDLVEKIHQAAGAVDFIVINAGAYTHTSVAIVDALCGVDIPFVEVHLSNIYQRESFRHHSYLSSKAVAVLCGMGAYGYRAALGFIAQYLSK